MKKCFLAVVTAVAVLTLSACGSDNAKLADTDLPKSDQEKYSYSLGMNMAKSLVESGVELDKTFFNAGFYDTYDETGIARMTPSESREAMTVLQTMVQQKQAEERERVAGENKKAAEEFLAKNASEEGVVTTESGLQYKIVTAGDGATAGPDDTVEVHYEGRLLDGTVFDSSYDRGQTARFGVGQVIPGWTEALQLMPAGSKWQLYIPPEIGYGVRGAGALIGPNSALVFDVELIAVESQPEADSEQAEAEAESGEA